MGVIDLPHLLRELVNAGVDAPIGVEVISDEMSRLPPLVAARLAAVAAQAILDAL
jgi:sugar phosphate isomerase/epimerase